MLGHAPLVIAAFNKRTADAKLLVKHKADLNLQSKKGECALHHAIMAGGHDIVRYLLAQRADHWLKTKVERLYYTLLLGEMETGI